MLTRAPHPGNQCPALRQWPDTSWALLEYIQTDIWVRFQRLQATSVLRVRG